MGDIKRNICPQWKSFFFSPYSPITHVYKSFEIFYAESESCHRIGPAEKWLFSRLKLWKKKT